MAEEEGGAEEEVKVVPDDPEFTLEEHIVFKRRLEAINVQLRRLIQEGLADFKLIMDGTAYAYTKLTLSNKGIVMIPELIAEYPQLRLLDLSCNQIPDITHVQRLRFLSSLNLSRNCISEGRFLYNPGVFPYLKHINLSNNQLKGLPCVELPRVLTLNISNNLIASVSDFDGHPTLETL